MSFLEEIAKKITYTNRETFCIYSQVETKSVINASISHSWVAPMIWKHEIFWKGDLRCKSPSNLK